MKTLTNIPTKNRIIVDLLKFVDVNIWYAENETFDNYPVQFCVKPEDYLKVKSLLDQYDIEYEQLDFNVTLDTVIVFDINSNICSLKDISNELSVVVLSVNKDNHVKFLSLFCD